MSARYTVYCKKSVAQVTPEEILKGARQYDLRTAAENDDVPGKDINDAMGQLRMENADPTGFRLYRLCFRPESCRQVDIDRWPTAGEVRVVVEEVLQDLESRSDAALLQLRHHLDDTVDIVSASYGVSAEEKMAPTLAYQAIRWFAEYFEGVIRAPDRTWWKLGPHAQAQSIR